MNSPTHFLVAFVLLLPLGWVWALVGGIIAVLIDVDHYMEHIIHAKKNRFSLKKAWNNSAHFHKFNQRSIVHRFPGGVVVGIISFLISFLSRELGIVLCIAYVSHMMLDIKQSHERKVPIKIFSFWMTFTHLEIGIICVTIVSLALYAV